jgi:hypothetical protein
MRSSDQRCADHHTSRISVHKSASLRAKANPAQDREETLRLEHLAVLSGEQLNICCSYSNAHDIDSAHAASRRRQLLSLEFS